MRRGTASDGSNEPNNGRIGARGMRTASVEIARDSRRRALAALPSLFTLLNMLCGFACILVSISGNYSLGAVLVGCAVVLDITDGAVARLVGSVTPFGLQFDSLADLVSFGMAPAVLAFSWAMSDINPLGWLACFVWLAAAAIRLARFNVLIDPRSDKTFFSGLPSPGAAGVVIASVFAFSAPLPSDGRMWALLVLLVPAVLMVTSIKFRSFRSLVTPGGRPYHLIGLMILLAVGFSTYPEITGLVLAYGYLTLPLLSALVSPLHRQTHSPGG